MPLNYGQYGTLKISVMFNFSNKSFASFVLWTLKLLRNSSKSPPPSFSEIWLMKARKTSVLMAFG